MAILPIRIYPDPVLRVRAEPISSFDQDLARLAENMVETMYAAPGIGLAAPQVGVSLRLAVVDLSVGKEPGELLVLVNPRRFPDPTADALSSNAVDVLAGARVCSSLEEALEGTVLAVAAVGHSYDASHELVTSREAAAQAMGCAGQGQVAF
nr:peptide deformylase [Thermoanaerobaculia bacterium]